MAFQTTIRIDVSITGIGLHSGEPATVRLVPSAPGSGISFVRMDRKDRVLIPAKAENVVSTRLATTLGFGDSTISTVEHLLAALAGHGIDNLLVEVSGPELPILDGSAREFSDAILKVGIQTQLSSRQYIRIKKKIELRLGEKWAVIEPSDHFELHSSIEFDHPSIGYQENTFIGGVNQFTEIAAARTFCLLKDVEAMRRMGLAKGGSLKNAVVVDDAHILNPEGLRCSDEFARHKALDALGDFKLSGLNILGSFRLHRSGHDLNTQLIARIFSDPSNYEIVDGTKLAAQKKATKRPMLSVARGATASSY